MVQIWENVTEIVLNFVYFALEVRHTLLEELSHVGVFHQSVEYEECILLIVIYLEG
jgi:hypothetical protein